MLHSTETKEILRKQRLENPSGVVKQWMDGVHINGRKPTKYVTVDGSEVTLDSSWEVKMAISLDKFGIKWIRPSSMVLDDGRSYTPDFYLPDFDIYLDPKFENPKYISTQKERIELWKEKYKKPLLIINEKSNCCWTYVNDKIKNGDI